jgi:23S rRNA G2445 N2-methylase RlmL
VFAQEDTVRREVQDRAVEGPSVSLNHADDQINAELSRCAAELIDDRTGNVYTAFPVTPKVLPAFIRARTDN